jgi:glucose/arabinose dehydrogenase
MPRQLFTGILALSLVLAACSSPLGGSSSSEGSSPSGDATSIETASIPSATTLPTPIAETATLEPSAIPSADAPQPTQTPSTSPTAAVPTQIPDPTAYTLTRVVGSFTAPTDIRNAGDGSGRLFVLEQPGRIRIVKDNQLLDAPFLDITDRVGSNGSEQGLLGLAFHPKFSQNGYFYVNYTDQKGDTHISRFTASGDSTDPASEKQLLFVDQPFPNHNGGALSFGPDGFLYIGLGDGGSQGDPYGNGQSTNTLLGKILRIDVDNGDPYGIPVDNPFANGGGSKEIWAYGLRNPWRISFDRATSDLWIGDVGQSQWEEIDFVPAGTPGGLNFGWNKMEGMHPYKNNNQPILTLPIVQYPHGAECSVTGGYVYRGAALPEWQGIYFYGDYCSGKIWGLINGPSKRPKLLFDIGLKVSTFGEDEAGELYVADYNGAIYRLEKQP